MSKIIFQKVAIIGVGLIGGSLGLELIRRKLAKEVVGHSRSSSNLKLALRKKLITKAAPSIFDAVVEADCIIVAVPVVSTLYVLPEILHLAKPGALVMDVGSTKEVIVEWSKKYCPRDVTFIGAHPMAGRELSGPQAALAGLFEKRACILTPLPKTPASMLKKAAALWKAVGMNVKILSPKQHDEAIGTLSHLPQMAAYALMHAVGSQKFLSDLSGSGLRDTTRLAASDPQMWLDICLTNKKELLKGLGNLEKNLSMISKFVRQGNQKALKKYFTRANQLKQKLL